MKDVRLIQISPAELAKRKQEGIAVTVPVYFAVMYDRSIEIWPRPGQLDYISIEVTVQNRAPIMAGAEMLDEIEIEPAPGYITAADPGMAGFSPVCEFCGELVAGPCLSREAAAGCELPKAFNRIGGPGRPILDSDPQHPDRRNDRFRHELGSLINCHSRENGSDTPDFILAEFLFDVLDAWDRAVSCRTKWYGRGYTDRIVDLEAQLQAEGEHTAAAQAEIERLQKELAKGRVFHRPESPSDDIVKTLLDEIDGRKQQ